MPLSCSILLRKGRHVLVLVRSVSCTRDDLAYHMTSQQKEAQQPAAPKVAQSFRKPKVEDQERLAREAEREAAYQAARNKKSLAASFASLYGTKVWLTRHGRLQCTCTVLAVRGVSSRLTAGVGPERASTPS